MQRNAKHSVSSSSRLRFAAVALAVVAAALCAGCPKSSPPGGSPSASASSPPAPPLRSGSGLGLAFSYPEGYETELATGNPNAHQVAVSSRTQPGVLTIRHDPTAPSAPVSLDEVARMDFHGGSDLADGGIAASTLEVAGKSHEARSFRFRIFNVTQTDVVAVAPIGGKTYVFRTHAADEDMEKAARMFRAVLSSARAQ
jgi:hypothetical protein